MSTTGAAGLGAAAGCAGSAGASAASRALSVFASLWPEGGSLAAPAPLSSTVRTACPTLTFSPALTFTAVTLPLMLDGTSIVALSVSSSRRGWSFSIRSPTLTRTRTTSPFSTFSPSSGSVNSTGIRISGSHWSEPGSSPARVGWAQGSLNECRISLLSIDPQVLERLLDDLGVEAFLPKQCRQRRRRHMLGIHLEEVTKGSAVLT